MLKCECCGTELQDGATVCTNCLVGQVDIKSEVTTVKAITDHIKEEYKALRSKEATLHKALEGHLYRDLINYTKQYGYAMYMFNGTYTDKLVELLGRHPDGDEIIMLVDGGFSNFGAVCYTNTERRCFSGHINVD